ncbi:hypothetical protein ACFV2S_00780 [Streptomyces sp. NPDC059695]|uniref:hypothetical protein n=1 Tax=Streptomyces sp. NPDC059695 TaxID=3346910 RepID=UPI0036946056
MALTDDTQRFAALSARLTGFDPADLADTGLVEVYRDVTAEELGAERYALLLREFGDPCAATAAEDIPGGELRAEARALTYLWYTGSWPGPPPRLVSPRAYAEGLVWKAAGVTAPAAAPGGYGSWAEGGGR